MRIVFNLLTTLKPKTGVGQHAARLFAALAEQVDDLHAFPTGRLADLVRWLQRARSGGPAAWQRRLGTLCGGVSDRRWTAVSASHSGRPAAAAISIFTTSRISLHCPVAAVPAVATVHDLSVLLHPEWHPADRVRHFERQFLRWAGRRYRACPDHLRARPPAGDRPDAGPAARTG